MDLKRSYGAVYGHDTVKYEQDGKHFDGQLNQLKPASDPVSDKKVPTHVIENDKLANAKAFLSQILKENPLSKPVVYREAEQNNQKWDEVRDAFVAMGVVKYTQQGIEMWKLPEASE
jgi:hypothetical protein